MKTFVKVNTASLSASCCDYLVMITMVKFFKTDPLFAGIAGTVFGGIVNFLIGRYWVFKDNKGPVRLQGRRYFIVWTGNLMLNSFLLYLFIKILKVQYLIAKIVTSVTVALFYNYHLQKRYVFKTSDRK
jgi:putative flippase GtrA